MIKVVFFIFLGGTVDIIVHTAEEDGRLTGVAKASGGKWGGIQVDMTFLRFLEELVGEDVMKTFKSEYMSSYIHKMRDFEMKKRLISSETSSQVTLRMHSSPADTLKQKRGTTVTEHVKSSRIP